ncbi:MAG: BrnT family toxin [Chloroflexi bacterium]|nr:BrnT family toxin [Chloroflexota bacterium]
MGYSQRRRLLIICFAERDDIIRIISARKADTDE